MDTCTLVNWDESALATPYTKSLWLIVVVVVVVAVKGKKSFVSRTTRYRIQREKESSTCVSEADLDDYGLYVPCDSEPFDFYIRPTEEGCGDRSSFVEDSYPAKYDFESETSESDGDECDGASTPTQVEWYGSVPAESEHDDIAHVHDRPLFEGSPITTSANNVMVMEYSMKHNLTNETLADLLKLLNLLLPSPNNCPRSTHLMRKLFDKHQSFTRSTCYFCNNCLAQVDLCTNLECPKCKVKLANCTSSFIQIPMEQQLQKILASKFYITIVIATV